MPAPPATAALPPSVADIKAWTQVDFEGLDEPFSDDQIQIRIDRACAYLYAVTGRPIDSTMPKNLVLIAQEAVQLRVEQMVYWEQPDYQETANDDQIQSFSAGNYSETRRSAGQPPQTGIPEINPMGWLNYDIWLLCTDEMRDYWTVTVQGQDAAAKIPSFEVTEADWGNYGGLYPYSFGVGAFRQGVVDANTWGA